MIKQIPLLLALVIVFAFVSRAITGSASQCLSISNTEGREQLFPTSPGDQLSIRFKHSIYGSIVEEFFALRERGFELALLRYSEARLVEFYGHEQARVENGAWVVTPAPKLFPTLNVTLSGDAAMNLTLISLTGSRAIPLSPGSAARIAVAACQAVSNG